MNGNNRKKITIFDDDDFKVDKYPYNNTNQNKQNQGQNKKVNNNNQDASGEIINKIIYNDDGIPIGQEIDLSILTLLKNANRKKEKKQKLFEEYFSQELIIEQEEQNEQKSYIPEKRITKNNNRNISSKVKRMLNIFNQNIEINEKNVPEPAKKIEEKRIIEPSNDINKSFELIDGNYNEQIENTTLKRKRNYADEILREEKKSIRNNLRDEMISKSRVEQNKLKYEVNNIQKSRVAQNKAKYEMNNHQKSRVIQNAANYIENDKDNNLKNKEPLISNSFKKIPENIIIKEPLSRVKKEEPTTKKYKLDKDNQNTKTVNNQETRKNNLVENKIEHVERPSNDELKKQLSKIKRGKIATFEVKNNKPVNTNEENKKVVVNNKINDKTIKKEQVKDNQQQIIKTKEIDNSLKKEKTLESNIRPYKNVDIYDAYKDIDIPRPIKKEPPTKKKFKFNINIKNIQFVIISIILLVSSIMFIYNSIDIEKKPKITYKEKTKTNYTVFLNDTRFYEEEKVYNNYLSQVVKLIKINMDYKFNINKKANLKFKYYVLGDLIVVDREDKTKEIYKNTYVLSEVQEKDTKKIKEYTIKNSVSIDYNYYKETAEEFSKTYNLDTESYMKIYFVIDITSNKKNSFNVSSKEKLLVQIPLSEKYANIKTNEINKEKISSYRNIILVKNIYNLLSGIVLIIINVIYLSYYKKKRI